MAKSVTIHIEINNTYHKITSVYLGSDGSFKLDVPYCEFSSASAFKFKADYTKRNRVIPSSDFVQHFTSEHRPQLSIHASGFIQISGPGIKSGISDDTGEIKGLGIFSNPLHTPISSGPTCGIDIWGLEYFKTNETPKSTSIILRDSDFIKKVLRNKKRVTDLTDIPYNMYMLEFFVFPEEYSSNIKRDQYNREIFTHQFWNYYECPGAIFTLPIIRLRGSTSFLGILPMLFKSTLPEKHPYGFIMSSPSGTNDLIKNDLYHLQVIYPNIFNDEISKDGSLDY